MSNVTFITRFDVQQLIANRTSENTIIFLSGPTSRKTPLSLLRNNDVITVNGAADYLLDNGIAPFIYILTDARFLLQRRQDFYKFCRNSKYTIVNTDVYEAASDEDKVFIRHHCLVIRAYYKREKGGVYKKIRLHLTSRLNRDLLINVPVSKKRRLVGFSKDISKGYCSCHTVAYTAIQIAYSLNYANVICSGLDITGSCARFYNENNNPMPSELSRDLVKIIPFLRFMRDQVDDLNVFNMSDDTAIDYSIIPFISAQDISKLNRGNSFLGAGVSFQENIDSCLS